MKNQSQ